MKPIISDTSHTVAARRAIGRCVRGWRRCIWVWLLVLAGTGLRADEASFAEMAGAWSGEARVVVSWCARKTLPVRLDVAPDGQVSGRVGDALLTNARLSRNRGWLGRKLRLGTDYIVRGELRGAVVADEGVFRTGVSLPLNFSASQFAGGLHTTGSPFGGRESMVLSATGLRLIRVSAEP